MQQHIYITTGNGGPDAHDWARMLLHMMIRYAERKGALVALIEREGTEGSRIKSAMFEVTGDVSFESEIGVHRLVRESPFDPEHRRCTSFAAVTTSADQKIEWHTQIRSYVLHAGNSAALDHRTGHWSPQIDRVLDGELELVKP